jgi:hypothetical protein
MNRRDELNTSRRAAAGWIMVLLLVSSVVLTTACSSTSKADDPATLVYVGSPNDTWTAIHIVLIDLDYDVASEDRNEGKIRATRTADGTRPGSVLTIDQVARHDTISLYVRAEAASGDSPMDAAQRQDLAKAFLEPVKALLY